MTIAKFFELSWIVNLVQSKNLARLFINRYKLSQVMEKQVFDQISEENSQASSQDSLFGESGLNHNLVSIPDTNLDLQSDDVIKLNNTKTIQKADKQVFNQSSEENSHASSQDSLFGESGLKHQLVSIPDTNLVLQSDDVGIITDTNITLNDIEHHSLNNFNSNGRITKTIQKAIKATCVVLNSWESELKVGVIVNGIYNHKYNILEVTSNIKKLIPPYVYFDPLQFPTDNGFYGNGWKKLLQHLERESFKEGFSVCCNGYGNGSKQKHRRIVCKHSLLYRNNVQDRKAVSSYRVTRVSNDRLNGRGSIGRQMERRSRTARPTCKGDCCPFFFTIAFDSNGFFMRNGLGCSNHYGHPKVVSSKYNYPIRLLTDEEKNIAKSVIDADASKGIVRNVIGRRTGQIVSLQACHYLGTLGNDLKRLASLDGLSSSDRIINFFQDKSYDYILLYNSMNLFPEDSVDLVNDNYISSSSLYSNTKFIVPPNEQEDATKYASDSRVNRNLRNDQNLLVALAWVVPSERRLFRLFPETLFVDSVEDTNNEGRPLLTMSECDSNEKMFTFLRAFLPNQVISLDFFACVTKTKFV